jgi:hypothetical protein
MGPTALVSAGRDVLSWYIERALWAILVRVLFPEFGLTFKNMRNMRLGSAECKGEDGHGGRDELLLVFNPFDQCCSEVSSHGRVLDAIDMCIYCLRVRAHV